MTSLFTFGTCLVMLSFLVYFHDHLWMASILFDVNMYCRFFSISKLVNWVISDALVHESHGCRLDYVFSFVKKYNIWIFHVY